MTPALWSGQRMWVLDDDGEAADVTPLLIGVPMAREEGPREQHDHAPDTFEVTFAVDTSSFDLAMRRLNLTFRRFGLAIELFGAKPHQPRPLAIDGAAYARRRRARTRRKAHRR